MRSGLIRQQATSVSAVSFEEGEGDMSTEKDQGVEMTENSRRQLNRRDILLRGTTLAAATAITAGNPAQVAQAQEVLPLPEPPFKGVIGRTYKDSVPDTI